MKDMEMIYELWRRRTRHLSSPSDALFDNIHVHALLTFGTEELLPFLFRKIDDWGFFEFGLVSLAANGWPIVPEESRGRFDPILNIYREWGREKGYLPKAGEA